MGLIPWLLSSDAFHLLASPPAPAFLPALRHAEPLTQPLPSWQQLTRQMGVNLALLSRDMSLAGEGGGFLELA